MWAEAPVPAEEQRQLWNRENWTGGSGVSRWFSRPFPRASAARRAGRSVTFLVATLMVGALVWVGHTPAGENSEALEAYREQTLQQNAEAAAAASEGAGNIVPTAVEAELGKGPKIDGPAQGKSTSITLRSGDRNRKGVL